MTQWTLKAARAAAVVGLFAASAAQAQTTLPAAPAPAVVAPSDAAPAAPPAPKKAKKAAKPASASAAGVAVTVRNSRTVDLTELQAAEAGGPAFKKVLGNLKAGKTASATVPQGKDCKIDLHATFADGQTTEAEGVDVCTQKLLNLTE